MGKQALENQLAEKDYRIQLMESELLDKTNSDSIARATTLMPTMPDESDIDFSTGDILAQAVAIHFGIPLQLIPPSKDMSASTEAAVSPATPEPGRKDFSCKEYKCSYEVENSTQLRYDHSHRQDTKI